MSKELIRLVDCRMDFDGETVLDSINIYFNDSEFLTLLGPSGCGKDDYSSYYRRLFAADQRRRVLRRCED